MMGRKCVLSGRVSGGLIVALLLSGCTIEGGASPYRRDTSGVYKRIEQYKTPDGGIVLVRAKRNRIHCPHCGVSNTLGRSECTGCGKRLSLRPLMLPCAECGGGGQTQENTNCIQCQGTGWVQAVEDWENELEPATEEPPTAPAEGGLHGFRAAARFTSFSFAASGRDE